MKTVTRSIAGIAVLSILAVPCLYSETALRPVLDKRTIWRTYLVFGSDTVKTESGDFVKVNSLSPVKRVTRKKYALNTVEKPVFSPSPPPDGWASPDFDDRSWGRFRLPFGGPAPRGRIRFDTSASLLYLRGRFHITDISSAAKMQLSMSFRGGVVVYINGKELIRKNMSGEDIEPGTTAEEYPDEAFFSPDGKRLDRRKHKKKYAGRFKMRERSLSEAHIPAAMLNNGINVLAIEVHRAPVPEKMYLDRHQYSTVYCPWPRLAVTDITLKGGSVLPNTARPSGYHVWNWNITQRVTTAVWGDPGETPGPIRISGVRNGSFSGQVVVSSDRKIRDLTAVVTDLTGPGTIPADSVQIRWGFPDTYINPGRNITCFEGLENHVLKEVPVRNGAALQPIWITVNVPADAKPGNYTGSLSIDAQGKESVEVPVKIKILPYVLPDPGKFQLFVGMIQSPDSIAEHYNIPMWSDRHWELMEKSFALMAQAGSRTLYIPLVRRTHFGNKHSMVYWIPSENGPYTHDFSIVERYLDLAVKHLGSIPVVCLYCWETSSSEGTCRSHAKKDRDILFTVKDPKTGKLQEAVGPAWGTSECAAFWKPVLSGIRARLEKRGIGDSMMVGLAGDWTPTKAAVDTLKKADPKAPWVRHAHGCDPAMEFKEDIGAQKAAYLTSVWGIRYPGYKCDGAKEFGWRNPVYVARFARNDLRPYHPPSMYRMYAGAYLSVRGGGNTYVPNGYRGGVGRIGADFWPVIKDKRGRLRYLVARYPESEWGQLRLNYAIPYLFLPGRNGAVSTVRFEMIRENVQESEARALLEDAAGRPELRAQAGKDLSDRALQHLFRRIRTHRRINVKGGIIWHASFNWRSQAEQLYSIAHEISGIMEK